MNILLTGVTGFIGAALAKALWQQGYNVVACVHKAQAAHELELPYRLIRCDFMQDTDVSVWMPRLANIDVVINAVGIIQETPAARFQRLHADAPIALFEACQKQQIRILQISGLGADKPNSPFEFLSSKAQADHYLWSQCQNAVILYPSIVIGRGGASTALFSGLATLPLIPLVGDGKQRLNPIHIDDVCAVVLNVIAHWPSHNKKYYLAGPEVFSFKELLVLLRKNLGLGAGRFIAVPMPLMGVLARISEKWHLSTLSADSLRMFEAVTIEQANYSGVVIQPLSHRLACELATAQETFEWQARLIWPLLWFSLVLLWLFTGLTSAFLDQASGYALLAQANIHGELATVLIYAGAAADFLLGALMLLKWRGVYLAQMALMLAYMAIVTVLMPHEWLHPLGAITKNIPLLLVTYLLYRRSGLGFK